MDKMTLAAAVAVGIVIGGAGMAAVQPARAAGPVAQAWEYKISTSFFNLSEKALNRYASEGWDLVSTTQDKDGLTFVLRRPKP